MSTEKSSDEIDLREIFRAIGNFFSGIGSGFIYLLASLRKTALTHKTLFVSIFGVSQVVAVAYALAVRKDYYETSMILRSNYLNFEVVQKIVEELDLMCEEDERTVLAHSLGLSPQEAMNILEFEATSFVSSDEEVEKALIKDQLNNLLEENKDAGVRLAEKLEYQNASSYEVIVKVTEPELISSLDTAFINYIKGNDFVERRLKAQRKRLLDRRAKLVDVEKKVDSIKRIVFNNFDKLYESNRGSNNVILSEKALVSPIDVVHEELRLNELILDIDKELLIESDFVVVDGFTAFRKPANFSVPIVMIVAAGLSVVLSYLIVAFKKFNNYLAKVPVE